MIGPRIRTSIVALKRPIDLWLRRVRACAGDQDSRKAIIENLESALASERQCAAELRSIVNDLQFKTQVLETSYAKQLEDARQSAAQLEQALTEKTSRLVELENLLQQTNRMLAEVQGELDEVTAERNRLRRSLYPHPPAEPGSPEPCATLANTDPLSIDELLEDALWAEERNRLARGDPGAPRSDSVQLDRTIAEMLSPDLMLRKPAAKGSG